jgi:hypothetical protein
MPLLNTADNIYLGASQVDRVYLGADLVWQKAVANPYLAKKAELGAVWTLWDVEGSTWNDVSGGNRHGTIYGASSVAPPADTSIPAALKGDGVDDYVSVPHDAVLNPTSALSVELWLVRPTSVPHIYAPVIAKGDNTWQLRIAGSGGNQPARLRWDVRGNSVNTVAESNADILGSASWHHVVAVYSSPNVTVYVDGAVYATATRNNVDVGVDPNSMLTLFAQDNAGTLRRWSNYSAAAPSVYPVGLTQAQVQALRAASFEGV